MNITIQSISIWVRIVEIRLLIAFIGEFDDRKKFLELFCVKYTRLEHCTIHCIHCNIYNDEDDHYLIEYLFVVLYSNKNSRSIVYIVWHASHLHTHSTTIERVFLLKFNRKIT